MKLNVHFLEPAHYMSAMKEATAKQFRLSATVENKVDKRISRMCQKC